MKTKQLLNLVLVMALVIAIAGTTGCFWRKPPTTTTTTTTTTSATTTTTTTTPTTTTTTTVAPSALPPTNANPTLSLEIEKEGFSLKDIIVAAGANVTITFHNDESGVTHNFALYKNANGTEPIFVGQSTVGETTVIYKFTAPAKGTYYFRDDYHPTLGGTFVCQ